jgi:hypothetical protein
LAAHRSGTVSCEAYFCAAVATKGATRQAHELHEIARGAAIERCTLPVASVCTQISAFVAFSSTFSALTATADLPEL